MSMPPKDGLPPGIEKADFTQRIIAFVIDAVIMWVAIFIVQLTLGSALSAGSFFMSNKASAVAFFLIAIIDIAIVGGYSIFFIGSDSGQTIGMKIMNIRCMDSSTYGRVEINDSIIRFIVSIVSSCVCFLGYLWMLWDEDKITWQDKVAGTLVVKVNETTEPLKWP